jgi:Protein of unknown function (DUF3800)
MNVLLEHVWGKSPGQDRVWAQVTGLAPDRAVRRLLMALNFQAFFDESKSDEEFVLGGYIAPAETWAKFAKDWEVLLPLGTRAKNDQLHFKMSEMVYAGGMVRVQQFYNVIDKYHELMPISFRMNLKDFERAQERARIIFERLNWTIHLGKWTNPYIFSFRRLLDSFHLDRSLSKFEKQLPLNEKVDFIFDDKSEKSSILSAWDEIVEKAPDEARKYYSATPRFENDQEFLGLQTADLWAWWVRHWYEEDSFDPPDKMKNFDFGTWRGHKRAFFHFSMQEDDIINVFQTLAAEAMVEGVVDPITLSRRKGEL